MRKSQRGTATCVLALIVLSAGPSSQVAADVSNMQPGLTNLQFVPVGDPGNSPDTRYHDDGSVEYTYSISKFELTAAQYTEFLKAVATTDTYGLYSPGMQTGCHILRSGTLGNYTYSVSAEWANRPVTGISWGDAARFANWLTNGQPSGSQAAVTTERGSYALDGATSNDALMAIARGPSARYVIPTLDEWYKAAYYRGGSGNAGYWDYATQSNTAPKSEPPPGYVGPPGSANYYNGLYPDLAHMTTEVGAYAFSPGAYGTFDQTGNVLEWTEGTLTSSVGRKIRGGYYGDNSYTLKADISRLAYPADEWGHIGVRIAYVPEPITLAIFALGGLWVACRRHA